MKFIDKTVYLFSRTAKFPITTVPKGKSGIEKSKHVIINQKNC
ncbi:hypothetical protein [uncultured Methanolobus sp.]|nr:hypothetical protein [uncultured Methanolobus sp.]